MPRVKVTFVFPSFHRWASLCSCVRLYIKWCLHYFIALSMRHCSVFGWRSRWKSFQVKNGSIICFFLLCALLADFVALQAVKMPDRSYVSRKQDNIISVLQGFCIDTGSSLNVCLCSLITGKSFTEKNPRQCRGQLSGGKKWVIISELTRNYISS